jgi:hypothetical protein
LITPRTQFVSLKSLDLQCSVRGELPAPCTCAATFRSAVEAAGHSPAEVAGVAAGVAAGVVAGSAGTAGAADVTATAAVAADAGGPIREACPEPVRATSAATTATAATDAAVHRDVRAGRGRRRCWRGGVFPGRRRIVVFGTDNSSGRGSGPDPV